MLLTWSMEGRLPPLKKCQILPVLLLGMTGVFTYNVMFFKGLKIIEAGRASLIIATCPVFIAIASAVLLREPINPIKSIGIIVALCGAIVVISRGNLPQVFKGGFGLGELYIFCCVLSWVAYSLIGKHVMNNLSALASVSYSATVGAMALSVPAYFEGLAANIGSQSAADWLSILYLSVFGTVVGFVWYYQGVQHLGPTKAGLFINFVPIFGVLFAYLILKEPVSASLAIGTVLVICGVYLTTRPAKVRVT
jgi:drug/metabolite transporter (DMT)-like permease